MIILSQMFNGSFRVDTNIYGTFSKTYGVNIGIILVEKSGHEVPGTFNVQIHPSNMQMQPTAMYIPLPILGMQNPPMLAMQNPPTEILIQPGLCGIYSVQVDEAIPYASPQSFNGIFLVDVDGEPYKGSFSINDMDFFRRTFWGTFTVEHQFLETMGQSWRTLLCKDIVNKDFLKLHDRIEYVRKNDVVVYPPRELIWSWSEVCPFDTVKVVIIGQDPYPTEGKAHGLAFSIAPDQEVRTSRSLSNIFNAIAWDYEQLRQENPQLFVPQFSVPKHGCLNGWARQGVLLLNTYLTLQKHHENSKLNIDEHKQFDKLIKKGWEAFTDQVIKYLSERRNGIVFMLWGEKAKRKQIYIDQTQHHVLESVHPSSFPTCADFKYCRHFSACNKRLEEHGHSSIDWNCLPEY